MPCFIFHCCCWEVSCQFYCFPLYWIFLFSLVTFNIFFLSLMFCNFSMIQMWLFLFITLEFHLAFLVSGLVLSHKPEKFFAMISDNCLISLSYFSSEIQSSSTLEHFKLSLKFSIHWFVWMFLLHKFFGSVFQFNNSHFTNEHYALKYVQLVLHFNNILYFKSYVLLFFSMIGYPLWTFFPCLNFWACLLFIFSY